MPLFGPPIIAALKDTDWNVRMAAAEALGKIGDDRAVEPLVAALKDEDSNVRWAAAEALGKIGDARAVEPLIAALIIAALKAGDLGVRLAAAEALGKIGAPAVEPLIAVLKDSDWKVKDSDWKVRGAAVNALAKIGAPAVEPLIAVLKDGDWEVRWAAANALRKIGDARAVEPLIAALEDKVEGVHKAAAEALVQIGAPAVEPLITALKNLTGKSQDAGMDALEQMVARIDKDLRARISDDVWSISVKRLLVLYDASPRGEGFLRGSAEAEPVEQIGRILNEVEGSNLMLEVHANFARLRPRAARNLEHMWTGIGGWMG